MHRLNRILAGTCAVALLLLAACSAPERASAPQTYRNRGVEIYSNAVLDPARLAGDWAQVAAFGPVQGGAGGGDCRPDGVRFGTPAGGAVPLTARLCLGGQMQRLSGPAVLVGPGRLQPADRQAGTIGEPWWVLWADVDDRTLVIGTPSGAMGFILNRGGPLPPDRLAAAREILEWNGYDLRMLQIF